MPKLAVAQAELVFAQLEGRLNALLDESIPAGLLPAECALLQFDIESLAKTDFTEMPDSEERLAHLRKLFVILSEKISARADIWNGFCDFMKNGGADRGA